MKITREYAQTLFAKISHAQKVLEELEVLLKLVDDNSDFDQHDIKAINRFKGSLMNLKGAVKRARKRSDNNG